MNFASIILRFCYGSGFRVQGSKVEYVSIFVFGDKSETGVFSLLFCSGFPVSLSIVFVKGSVYSYMMFYLHS